MFQFCSLFMLHFLQYVCALTSFFPFLRYFHMVMRKCFSCKCLLHHGIPVVEWFSFCSFFVNLNSGWCHPLLKLNTPCVNSFELQIWFRNVAAKLQKTLLCPAAILTFIGFLQGRWEVCLFRPYLIPVWFFRDVVVLKACRVCSFLSNL